MVLICATGTAMGWDVALKSKEFLLIHNPPERGFLWSDIISRIPGAGILI